MDVPVPEDMPEKRRPVVAQEADYRTPTKKKTKPEEADPPRRRRRLRRRKVTGSVGLIVGFAGLILGGGFFFVLIQMGYIPVRAVIAVVVGTVFLVTLMFGAVADDEE